MESVKAARAVRDIVNRNIVCDECRNPVFVYGKGMVGGFVMAGHDLNDPRVEVRRAPKYNHYGKNSPRNNGVKPVKECSLYCPHIAAFKDAKKAARDPRLEKEVRARLAEPETKALNLAVLKELHRAATKKWPTETEIATYRHIALADFMVDELLLPILTFCLMPSSRRCLSLRGRERKVSTRSDSKSRAIRKFFIRRGKARSRGTDSRISFIRD
jgi:hypothetical protein